MNDIDMYIKDIVTKNIYEHSSYEYNIKNALISNTEKQHKQNTLLKKIAIIVASITTIGGIVFAKQISETFTSVFKNKPMYNNDKYIQMLEDNYKTIDELNIKIDSILVDDYNIQFVIDFEYKNDISYVDSKIKVRDENYNLIFENEDFGVIKSFTNTNINKKSYKNHLDAENTIENSVTNEIKQYQYTKQYKSSFLRVDNKNIKRILDLYPDDNSKFPESKKLYIELENFVLKNNSNIIKDINKKCIFEIDVDSKLLNREIDCYIQEELKSNQDFMVLDIKRSNTQLKLKMEYLGEQDVKQIINTKDLNEIQVFDGENNIYYNTKDLYIFNNKILNLQYDIDKDTLSNNLTIIIKNSIRIPIKKSESSI